jgi:hypothetical protein
VVPPQPKDQARFVGATDLLARIKAFIFLVRHLRAQSLVPFSQGVGRIGDDRARWPWAASFRLHDGRCQIVSHGFRPTCIKTASPNHNLVRIADVMTTAGGGQSNSGPFTWWQATWLAPLLRNPQWCLERRGDSSRGAFQPQSAHALQTAVKEIRLTPDQLARTPT